MEYYVVTDGSTVLGKLYVTEEAARLAAIDRKGTIHCVYLDDPDHSQRVAHARQLLEEASRAEILEGARDLFDRFEAMQSFSFAAYTPHFNDGDACTFRVNDGSLWVDGTSEDDLDRGYSYERTARGEYTRVYNGNQPSPKLAWCEAIRTFLNSIEDRKFLDAFGDHVKLTFHRSGQVEAQEHEHD